MLERIAKLLAEFLFSVAALTMISFGAYAVRRQHWFGARPALSSYVWFQAIVGSGLFLLDYISQACSATVQYDLCRVYFVGYWAFIILTCFFTLSVVYEFLFCLGKVERAIHRKAIAGFAITAVLAIIGAVTLGSASTTTLTVTRMPERSTPQLR